MVNTYRDLRVYKSSMNLAYEIFQLTKLFPAEEKYSMTDQMRRSSRSVCANLGEAWKKRRYRAAFAAKLNDAEGEACETQVWLELAARCGYLSDQACQQISEKYEQVQNQLASMIYGADKWVLKS